MHVFAKLLLRFPGIAFGTGKLFKSRESVDMIKVSVGQKNGGDGKARILQFLKDHISVSGRVKEDHFLLTLPIEKVAVGNGASHDQSSDLDLSHISLISFLC